jgi:predicted nucleic acid binding AN1-type Zn finger protein
MEFPDLGRHCSKHDCKQLDFLPFTCDACKKVFCLDHRTYKDHTCAEVKVRDKKAQVCPLCNIPVPCGPNEDVDEKMNRHIEDGCKSEARERKKAKRCSVKRCRKTELLPIQCAKCSHQYCLGHRLPSDHNCDAVRRETMTAAHMLRRSTNNARGASSSGGLLSFLTGKA